MFRLVSYALLVLLVILGDCCTVNSKTSLAFEAHTLEKTNVRGISMQPTFYGGDGVEIDLSELEIKRGEVWCFLTHDKKRRFVKRVVGLPGESIELIWGWIFIDGKLLVENYRTIPVKKYSHMIWKIQKDHFFVMGDNRGESADSRMFGTVPRKNFIGKLIRITSPENRKKTFR